MSLAVSTWRKRRLSPSPLPSQYTMYLARLETQRLRGPIRYPSVCSSEGGKIRTASDPKPRDYCDHGDGYCDQSDRRHEYCLTPDEPAGPTEASRQTCLTQRSAGAQGRGVAGDEVAELPTSATVPFLTDPTNRSAFPAVSR